MLDVLLFLAVPGRFFEGLDDQRGRRWNDGDGGLTVLDGKFDGDAETFLPVGTPLISRTVPSPVSRLEDEAIDLPSRPWLSRYLLRLS